MFAAIDTEEISGRLLDSYWSATGLSWADLNNCIQMAKC